MIRIIILALILFSPKVSFAQEVTNIQGLFSNINKILSSLVPIIFALALLAFLWGVFKYSIANDPKDRKTALQFMINGIIALFVMFSVWGFVFLLRDFFGFETINWNPGAVPEVNLDENETDLLAGTRDKTQDDISLDGDDIKMTLGDQENEPDTSSPINDLGSQQQPFDFGDNPNSQDPNSSFNPQPTIDGITPVSGS